MNAVQLELELFPHLPWMGYSPRALTRGHLALILKAQAVKSVSDLVRDPSQLEFWPSRKKARKIRAPSAPTLLPLPRRKRYGAQLSLDFS